MHDSRMRSEWERTAALLAMVHNCAFGVKHPLAPDDLNPYAEKKPCVSSDFVAALFGNAEKVTGTKRESDRRQGQPSGRQGESEGEAGEGERLLRRENRECRIRGSDKGRRE